MPNYSDIEQEIVKTKSAAQDVVRRKYLRELHAYTKRDTIIYASAYAINKTVPASAISISTDDIPAFMTAVCGLKGDRLDLILHSPGGSLEAAEQIVNYLRSKYEHIRAIIPQNAMSAATMIACACDEIIMGKQSAIGPIDPQVTFPTQHGLFTAPAQALLDDFEQAKKEIAENNKLSPLWISRMKDYPPGIFQICHDTLTLAKEKVCRWLEQYMFKGERDAKTKAKKIAAWLGDAHDHKTHGHPINLKEAQHQGLKVISLESDQNLQENALSVFHAMLVTFSITTCVKLIENHMGRGRFIMVQTKNG